MTPDRLRRIAEVLEIALELDADFRKQYLDQIGQSDEDLGRRVAELVEEVHAADQRAATTAERSPAAGAGPNEVIGPYRVVRWLGMGGMGTVYLAERADEEFERQVAIKVIRLGFDVAEVRKRFLSERQILASFDHPNIARMYEGGTTDEGHPFLVMEYVEGLPIDQYCDENRLTVKDRLALFRQVCSAVEYAHRNLVVHRDLKPSNVLVTADGTPKLLDFGIAKLLDPEHFPLTIDFTETGGGPLTPNYASPEQIRGERITTSSDVYALGVLLYKLLTGHLPFDRAKRSREALAEQADALPTRPSLAVGTKSASTQRADTRTDSSLWSTDTSTHQRQLQGDLDNIVLMAIRHEPDKRYGSADQLAEDISRYLDGQPVAARDAGTFYRLSKFVQRHRLPVLASATALLLTLGFLGVTLRQNSQIRQQAISLEASKTRAEKQTERAEEIADFFVELFNEIAPDNAKGEELSGRQLLERAATKLEESPSADPAVRARLLATFGEALRLYGDLDRATPLLEQAVVESEAVGGATRAYCLYLRSWIEPLDEAIASMREAAAILEELGTDEHQVLGTQENLLAAVLGGLANRSRDLSEAEAYYRRAIEITTRNRDYEELAWSHINFAAKVFATDAPKAADLYQQAREVLERHRPDALVALSGAYRGLALAYQNQGLLEEARPFQAKSLELARLTHGEEAGAVAVSFNNLAQFHNFVGEYVVAEGHARKSIQIFAKAAPASQSYPLNNLGRSLISQSRFDQAIEAVEQALELRENERAERRLLSTIYLIKAHRQAGRSDRARSYFSELQALYGAIPDLGDRRYWTERYMPMARLEMGWLEAADGDPNAAEAHWRLGLERSESALDSRNIDQIRIRMLIELCLGLDGEISEELDFLRRSGAKDRDLELFCAQPDAPAICEQLTGLFPPGLDGLVSPSPPPV